MANRIVLRRSTISNTALPTSGVLVGEIFANTADLKLFLGTSTTTTGEIAYIGFSEYTALGTLLIGDGGGGVTKIQTDNATDGDVLTYDSGNDPPIFWATPTGGAGSDETAVAWFLGV